MRMEAIWDKWMIYDDDGFCFGIRPDAPEDVKKAYNQHISEQETLKETGMIQK